jgi:hypothetical protein
MPKLFTLQQDIATMRAAYTETETTLKADADRYCTICGGRGCHWGDIISSPANPRGSVVRVSIGVAAPLDPHLNAARL